MADGYFTVPAFGRDHYTYLRRRLVADITMCEPRIKFCRSAIDCYRHEALPDKMYQSWADFSEYIEDGGSRCPYFWEMKRRYAEEACTN